ncbi:MAG TPA: hypothetical protein VJ867_14320 [Gemmatimonadaceae bacterium]|nr:hypothetical protein [Gemmatimonadaceae bacterium]
MPYRTFVDSAGAEWQVWDIVPRLSERRSIDEDDRRVETRPIPFPDRRRDDRRLTQARRTTLRGTYAFGWLCFDCGTEKRRLTPIPTDWTTCADESLETYSRRAQTVASAYRVFDQDDSSLAEAG